MKNNTPEHREGLIIHYENQAQTAGPFMKIVLKEAIRKLNESDLNPSQVEEWVIRLEKDFRTIPN